MKFSLFFLLFFVNLFYIQHAFNTKFNTDALAAHNHYRKFHKVPLLKLDKNLAKAAQKYAEKLAKSRTVTLTHSTGRNNVGENLFWSSNNPTGESVTKYWYSEIRNYNFNKPGYSKGTGHFTQLVWRNTQLVGFGVAQSSNGIYVVANYYPAGNYVNQYPQNVLRPNKNILRKRFTK